MSVEHVYGTGYAASAPNEGYVLARRKGKTNGKVIIALHGANNTAVSTWLPYHAHNFAGIWTQWLADEGYTFMAIDDAGATSWGDDAAMARIDDALTFLAGLGYPVAKVGLMAWSMGGVNALNWLKRNPAKVACSWLWAPLTNLGYAHTTIDPTTVDAAYGGNYAVNSVGHDPSLEPASYRGLAPVQIIHAINDAVIPIQQSRDFVAAVNDASMVLSEVDTGASAGHYALFMPVPTQDPLAFFRSHL